MVEICHMLVNFGQRRQTYGPNWTISDDLGPNLGSSERLFDNMWATFRQLLANCGARWKRIPEYAKAQILGTRNSSFTHIEAGSNLGERGRIWVEFDRPNTGRS